MPTDILPHLLASSIAHWLEYEDLCKRSIILSEASLKSPVADFLIANNGNDLLVEQSYPDEYQADRGRPRAADFCLTRPGGDQVWTAILESKFVTMRRDYTQEVFDDIFRLEAVRRTNQKENFNRYFVMAGEQTVIKDRIFDRQYNVGDGGGRKPVFADILPLIPNEDTNVPVATSSGPVLNYWSRAADEFNLTELPLTIRVTLVADAFTGGKYRCCIWRISSTQNRQTRSTKVVPTAPTTEDTNPADGRD
ncbi:hypothetical protein WME94_34400 [Sorangium sp. So ce429]